MTERLAGQGGAQPKAFAHRGGNVQSRRCRQRGHGADQSRLTVPAASASHWRTALTSAQPGRWPPDPVLTGTQGHRPGSVGRRATLPDQNRSLTPKEPHRWNVDAAPDAHSVLSKIGDWAGRSAELPDGAFGGVGEVDAQGVELGAELVGAGPVSVLAGPGAVGDELLDGEALRGGQVTGCAALV
jgi:hypothetical protein